MQPVSQAFLDEFAGANPKPKIAVSVLASSGFAYAEGLSISATASETKETYPGSGVSDQAFAATNVIEGISSEPKRYAVTDVGTYTDQGWATYGPGSKYNPGWWTRQKSDSTGALPSPFPYVQVDYTPYAVASRLRVTTTTAYPGLSYCSLAYRLYGSTQDITVGPLQFVNGRAEYDLGDIKQITRITCYAISTQQPSDYGRVLEVEAVHEIGEDAGLAIEDYVLDARIIKSSGTQQALAPALPGVGLNELRLTLSRDCQWIPKPHQLVQVKMGYGNELLPQGYYLVSEVSPGLDTIDIIAHGLMSLANNHLVPALVFSGQKRSAIISELLAWSGLANTTVALESDDVIDWYIVDNQCEVIRALGDACQALLLAVYEDETGAIVIRDVYGTPVATLEDELIGALGEQTYKPVNHVQVFVTRITEGAQDSVLSASGRLEAGATTTYTFTLSKRPVTRFVSVPWVRSFRSDAGSELPLPEIVDWGASCDSLWIELKNTTQTAGTFEIEMDGVPLLISKDDAVVEAKDDDAIRLYGYYTHDVHIYTLSTARAQNLASALLNYMSQASRQLKVRINRPAPHLQLRDVITVDSAVAGIQADYVITEISLDLNSTELNLVKKEAFV
ncbi:MAG: hypothetical protein HPY71_13725 [Firmicutes bacterium]|nr:hypothetical protein [Bacillota bacterium]